MRLDMAMLHGQRQVPSSSDASARYSFSFFPDTMKTICLRHSLVSMLQGSHFDLVPGSWKETDPLAQ